MNRTLTAFLAAAAVVGATGGTVAATTLADDRDDDRTTPASASTPPGSPTAPSGPGPGTPGDVLWANQRSLHDGATEVAIQLLDAPASVERAAGGWVVTTRTSPQEPSYEAFYVTPDGSTLHLADTFLDGDVSPDGTRYVAMQQDGGGYGVWDVATQQLASTVDEGSSPDQFPSGGAQFLDDDTVATTWRDEAGRVEVLSGGTSGSATDLVSDALEGSWAISPDGAWIAGTSRDGKDVETGFAACALVAPVDRSEEGVTDCGSTFATVPSWSPDSSGVLALPYDTDGFGPGSYRTLRPGRSPGAGFDLPQASYEAVHLDDDTVVVLSATDYDGDGTVISTCTTDGCEQVDEAGDAGSTAVLGTTT